MLLKRMDETISQNLYDIPAPEFANVVLFEPELKDGDKVVHYRDVGTAQVPLSLLHYNDVSDGSNKFNGSWQKFYAAAYALEKGELFSGSSIFFGQGSPNFGGVAKAAIYLRYSKGFIDWLGTFDQKAAANLRDEVPFFEALMNNPQTKQLPMVWHDFKKKNFGDIWPLLTLAKLSNGKYLVLWLQADGIDEQNILSDDLDIDVEHSQEIMRFLTTPPVASKEKIIEEFQFAKGQGRNAFGQEYQLDAISDSEYQRLMGAIPENERGQLIEFWSNKAEYRIKVAPNPDNSSLLFLPEGDLSYLELKEFIDGENAKKSLYWEQKTAKKSNEDSETWVVARPDYVPVAGSTTIFLTNEEGSTKKKRIIQQIFPAISLNYLQLLNAELLISNLQFAVVNYMKRSLTGQDGDTPSVYRYWTTLFTNALQKQPISGWEVYNNFQRFAKSFKGEDLIDNHRALNYWSVMGKVLRLQHLILTAQNNIDRLSAPDFQVELSAIENFNFTTKIEGVFGPMNENSPTLESLLPVEVITVLRDKQKAKLESFVRQAYYGVPNRDFVIFVRGALIGMLLNELCFMVNNEGRRFSATQGRHPSRLRGRELMSVFDKGIGLLMNLDKAQLFNCSLLPFIKSMEEESRRDAFNSGLIVGMVYYEKKSTNNKENNQEVSND